MSTGLGRQPTDVVLDTPVEDGSSSKDEREVPGSTGPSGGARTTGINVGDPDVRRFAWGAALGGLAASIPFVAVLWNFGLNPFRFAVPRGYFSNFYEIQAHAFMHGHITVPKGSLSFEAFVHNGHQYLYFGPLPAILRIPIMAITHKFDGRMSAPSILVAWILFLTFTSLLVWRVRRMLGGNQHLSRREAAVLGLFIASAGASVMVYLAALPWVYHEALAWSTSLAVGAFFAILGVVERHTTGRVASAGILSAGAILSRTTAGWACCLTLLALAVLAASRGRNARPAKSGARGLLLAGLLPFVLGIAVNWAKFSAPLFVPYKTQVWTTLSAHRRAALAHNAGGLFNINLLPTTLISYFRPDGIRFVGVFPFVTLPAKTPANYAGAYLDLAYRTGSVPDLMPLLFVLACWGVVLTFRRRAGETLSRLRIPILGAASVTGGIMFVAYISPRYVVEFMPVLVLAGAIGLLDLTKRISSWKKNRYRVAMAVMAALAVFGAIANTAVSAIAARDNYGGPTLASWIATQEAVSNFTGHGLKAYVEKGTTLTPPAASDHIRVIGVCQAVYVGTGETTQPWAVAQIQGMDVSFTVTGAGRPGSMKLARFHGPYDDGFVELERNADGKFRLSVSGGAPSSEVRGTWEAWPVGSTVDVRIGAASDYSTFDAFSSTSFYAQFPLVDWDNHGDYTVGIPYLLQALSTNARNTGLGVQVTLTQDAPSAMCRNLLDR